MARRKTEIRYGITISTRLEVPLEKLVLADAQKNERSPAGQVRWIIKEYYREKGIDVDALPDAPGGKAEGSGEDDDIPF